MADLLDLLEHPVVLVFVGFGLTQLVAVVVAILRMNTAIRLSQKSEAHLAQLVEKLDRRLSRLEELHLSNRIHLHTGE